MNSSSGGSYIRDFEPQERLAALVGLEDHKRRLTKILGLLVNADGLGAWAKRFHPGAESVVKAVMARPPLVVLAGDVGSGKSALAETIGDAVARQENIEITLFPLSLSTRGEGRVGEMTKLLSAAFEHIIDEAKKLKPTGGGRSRGAVLLLVDEADALAQSREAAQMHHEDRAGVNAFIRGVDRLGNGKLPAAVIMCTNRPGALDPAVRRRAAEILTFTRPDGEQRREAIAPALEQLDFSSHQIEAMVLATGPRQDCCYGFTYSDLTQRLLPAIVLDVYPGASRRSEYGTGNRAEYYTDSALSRRGVMSEWSLAQLLAGLHDDIQQRLGRVRKSFGHPGVKGDASEGVWLELLETYLPQRYRAATAHVVDSLGAFSEQIDIVVFDRQYSPFIFSYEGQTIIPAESVYAVFEAKQTMNAGQVSYARKKVASVRRLHRTSLPIPYAKGTYPAKPLIPILGGLLTFESDWSPALGRPFRNALGRGEGEDRLDIGCIAAHGYFYFDGEGSRYEVKCGGKPATAFLFKLISQLQFSGTVPMIDVQAYAEWLSKEPSGPG